MFVRAPPVLSRQHLEHSALVAAIRVEGVQGQRQAFESFALAHLGFQDLAQQCAPAQAEQQHGAVDTIECGERRFFQWTTLCSFLSLLLLGRQCGFGAFLFQKAEFELPEILQADRDAAALGGFTEKFLGSLLC